MQKKHLYGCNLSLRINSVNTLKNNFISLLTPKEFWYTISILKFQMHSKNFRDKN